MLPHLRPQPIFIVVLATFVNLNPHVISYLHAIEDDEITAQGKIEVFFSDEIKCQNGID